ncbi:MAG: Trk system potassium transporter TrkA [Ruminococcus sp.]|nr:Trk system potassium transporter TrkA [Ruminococcus sp.]
MPVLKRNPKPKAGLKIIVVGCGKVGKTLVEQLYSEGHDVTVIDQNAQRVADVAAAYDVMGVTGNGASFSTLMDAGIEKADVIIAVTQSDELNLLCCTVAKRVGKCSAIARVRNPDYGNEISYLREKLELAMIMNPELEAAREAARILFLPTALEVNAFANGQAELITFKLPTDNILDNKDLMSLSTVTQASVLICAIERGGEVMIPSGSFTIQGGDTITFAASRRAAVKFFSDIGIKTHSAKSTMIIGGGKAAYYLAQKLIEGGTSVKIIELDRQRCEELSVLLPKAVIINGDGTDVDLLKEEGIEYVESFVPLTGIDEENVLLTLHARQISDAKVITKINRINFKDVISGLDLGSVIYPRYITSEAIIGYVRAKTESGDSNIETLYHLFDHRAEAIEFKVYEDSKVTDTPLMELDLKPHLLVAFINRQGKIIIPSGQDCIKRGDTVMIVTTHTGFNDISDILNEH